jgi:RimJ/RimL family protein N-acetyltransferase
MEPFHIPTLMTERLRLRAFRKSDLDDYAALNADPEVTRYLGGGGPWDRGRSWRHLAFLLGHWHLGGSGMWALEQKETGTFLGMVGFAEPEGWPGCELAWTLARRWWGARLRHRGRAGRPGLRLHHPEKGPRHQPHPPGQPGLHPCR